MNEEEIKQKILLLYFQYRSFFIPCLVTCISVLLFIFVVIPQIQGYIALQNDVIVNRQKLLVLEQNFQQITGLSDTQLNDNFAIVSTALPQEKNASAILNDISHAASVSNVSLKDYSFQVGKLVAVTGETPLQFQLSVDGDISSMQQFIHTLYTSIPLAMVSDITTQGSASGSINVVFYAKPFTNASLNQDQPLQLLTDQDKTTLNKITGWENQ